jgi:hypothetical protein
MIPKIDQVRCGNCRQLIPVPEGAAERYAILRRHHAECPSRDEAGIRQALDERAQLIKEFEKQQRHRNEVEQKRPHWWEFWKWTGRNGGTRK